MNRKKISRPLFNQLGLVFVFCLVSITAMSQVKISGKVTGTDGKALPYISVVVKNTSFGSSTDLEGNYRYPPDKIFASLIERSGIEAAIGMRDFAFNYGSTHWATEIDLLIDKYVNDSEKDIDVDSTD